MSLAAARQTVMSAIRGYAMFKIDGTDFKIDTKKSRVKLRVAKDGSAKIDADIYGDKTQYEKITENEDSPWSWTLYPPHFYLHDYPAKIGKVEGKATAKISIDDLDENEAAIYLIEHNDIDDVIVTIADGGLTAKGTVFLSGRPHSFSIKFVKP